jgi:carbonic anhydrase/acetyltransferase-like protein (isoleucine patch superfamily)
MTRMTGMIGSLGDGATPEVHPEAWIAPGAVVVGNVTIGPAASIWYGSVLRADDDRIEVGPQCNIQDLCCLHVDAGEPAVLEERASLGHRATVHGAHIGAGSLIAAGAVVRPGMQVPAGVLVAGVPGRIVRELTDDDRAGFAQTAVRYARRAALHREATWGDAGAGPG